jgi:hypothetical protein
MWEFSRSMKMKVRIMDGVSLVGGGGVLGHGLVVWKKVFLFSSPFFFFFGKKNKKREMIFVFGRYPIANVSGVK